MITRAALPALLAVAALALGGCAATPAETMADDASPAATAPADESMTDEAMDEESMDDEAMDDGSTDDAASSPGAYVDYREGVIAETAGDKVLFFHAPWCTQCRQLEQSILSEGIPDGTTIIKVDFDSETELRQRYGVTLQTTVVHIDDEGEALGSTVLYDEPTIDALLASAP
ncbi:thioredoxin family protein [Microcella daejeonensis]|uniref:thioredoxin family protein n=1 Tax=Microcella daejeonensis TaxID=2994971 RepID=UPI00226DCCA4|nr:thioredoxin family protein [Microcella daejeonensis]WAB84236.1 thioredoxin family protein [Microcella daejeonensis]